MKDTLISSAIKAIKGILPDNSWDYIFSEYKPHQMKFNAPAYEAVRVNKDYILVKVPIQK